MMNTGKGCEQCGARLETDARHAARMKYCGDKCRYSAWKDRKERELKKLIEQLAGRSSFK